MIQQLQDAVQTARPDNWPEAVAIIISTLLSWWLGRKRRKRT